MGSIGGTDAGPDAELLDVEGTLLRAALLFGYGARARWLARRLASIVEPGAGRSCLEAGAPIQLTIDAPGSPLLRIGLRVGDTLKEETLEGLLPAEAGRRLIDRVSSIPIPIHASLGTWLFWTETRQSIYVDLRDPSPDAALARLSCALTGSERERLERVRPSPHCARPWALRIQADDGGLTRAHVHWLIAREASPQAVADTIAPGRWAQAVAVLAHLLRRPGASGRWVVATPLDGRGDAALRVGNTGWALVPEDGQKQRAVGALMGALGGPRDVAEALWSLCRGAASPAWRVGRACEVKVTPAGVRARLFFTPQTQGCVTAGTSISEPATF